MKRYTIEKARKMAKLSQEYVARELNISYPSYNSKEKYKHELRASELLVFAELVGLDPRQIIIKN